MSGVVVNNNVVEWLDSIGFSFLNLIAFLGMGCAVFWALLGLPLWLCFLFFLLGYGLWKI